MHISMHWYCVANAHSSRVRALGKHGGPSTLQSKHTLARSHCKLARNCFGSQWGVSTCKAITCAPARARVASPLEGGLMARNHFSVQTNRVGLMTFELAGNCLGACGATEHVTEARDRQCRRFWLAGMWSQSMRCCPA